MDELEFYKRYISYCDVGGHSYHGDDIAWAWEQYQRTPEKYAYLKDA